MGKVSRLKSDLPHQAHALPPSIPLSFPIVPDPFPIIPDPFPIMPDPFPIMAVPFPVIPDLIGDLFYSGTESAPKLLQNRKNTIL